MLPSNISYFADKYRPNMKAQSTAIQRIQNSIDEFEKSRQQSGHLQRMEMMPYQYQDQLVNNQLYLVRIKGRKNTYYQNRIIPFYLFFFDTFPEEPPEIVAPFYFDKTEKKQKPFLHINMDSKTGHVCTLANQKQKQYYKNTTLKDILIQLQKMIYFPNISSSYPSDLFCNYKENGDNSSYYQILNRQARHLEEFQDDDSSESEDDS